MNETADKLEVKLPSGKLAVIRNYTTRADEAAYNSYLYEGVSVSASEELGTNFALPIQNSLNAKDSYVRRLLVSLDGSTEDLMAKINELRSTDYEALDEAVGKVVDSNSPKAAAVPATTKTK